jgi:hypothetical protein
MTDSLSNAQAFIAAAEKITATGQLQANIAEPDAQASTIEEVISNLGIQEADVFAQVADVLANTPHPPATSAAGEPTSWTFTVNGVQVTISLPPPVGEKLPLEGKPDIEELFGAKASDPVDRFFINVAASIASVFSTFFGLASIQSRQVLQQFQATRPDVVLPPDLLADGVERNVFHEGNAAQEAAASGINATRFHDMVALAGEPPGPIQAIELYRRGKISGERFAQMIAYSRIKTEYIPDLMQLAYEPLSAADVIEARLKNVIPTDEEAIPKFNEAGGLTEDYQIALDSAGNAIGVESALNLWNHKLISEAEVNKVILHSRINPLFEGIAKLQRHRWLSPYQIHQALVAGTITPAIATEWLLQDGYSKEQAAAFANAAGATKPVKAKAETEAQVLELYESGFLPHDQAVTALENLGYPAAELQYLLDLQDAKRIISSTNAAITRLRAAYLARRVDLGQVDADLKALGVTPLGRQEIEAAWKVELESTFKELSAAQVAALVKDGLAKVSWGQQELKAMGYTALGANLYLASHTKDPNLVPADIRPPAK